MIGIIDYGRGNLRSVQNAMRFVGANIKLVRPNELDRLDGVILPGVGTFGDTSSILQPFSGALRDYIGTGKPFLGICVGLQYLFEEGLENGTWKGLGILDGRVERLPIVKLPQIGWNTIDIRQDSPILRGIGSGSYVYYINSYAAPPDNAIATSWYGSEYAAVVGRENLFATQFHPEKSGDIGLRILKNFLEVVEC